MAEEIKTPAELAKEATRDKRAKEIREKTRTEEYKPMNQDWRDFPNADKKTHWQVLAEQELK